jgi:hypothetical protein
LRQACQYLWELAEHLPEGKLQEVTLRVSVIWDALVTTLQAAPQAPPPHPPPPPPPSQALDPMSAAAAMSSAQAAGLMHQLHRMPSREYTNPQ